MLGLFYLFIIMGFINLFLIYMLMRLQNEVRILEQVKREIRSITLNFPQRIIAPPPPVPSDFKKLKKPVIKPIKPIKVGKLKFRVISEGQNK